jgi:hypothetical protein
MNKTLHKKLTEKHLTAYQPILLGSDGEDMPFGDNGRYTTGLGHEMNLLKEAAKDLLQPRPEAIARLLKMAKEL